VCLLHRGELLLNTRKAALQRNLRVTLNVSQQLKRSIAVLVELRMEHVEMLVDEPSTLARCGSDLGRVGFKPADDGLEIGDALLEMTEHYTCLQARHG
jgi:hypothetical protein